jgi:hypothetical protein
MALRVIMRGDPMNLKTLGLVSAALLFAYSPVVAQQKRPTAPARDSQPQNHTPDSFVPDEPKSCVEFDQMAARVDAVNTAEEITAVEFAAAATQPGVVTMNPGKVFDVGNSEYVATEENGKPTFSKVTTHKDKELEFLKWYRADNRFQMMRAGESCLLASPGGTVMAVNITKVIGAISQADLISEDSLRDLMGALGDYSSAQTVEIFRLKDRYNKLVENANAYNDAVNNLMSIVNDFVKSQRTSRPAPTFNFNFVRPQPITCTGNTMAISNSTAYFNNLDTVTNATTTIQCQ